jgi:hypothetical protein
MAKKSQRAGTPLAFPADFRGKIAFAAPPELCFWIERKMEGGGAR